jgi:hypothetical protein
MQHPGTRSGMTPFPRTIRCALLAIIAALSPSAYAAQPDAAVSLDQLMATLRTVRHVDGRYVERRTVHALRTPIETHGTLRFDAPDRLEKATDPAGNGASERLTIKGDQLTIDRGLGAAPVVLMLDEHPEIGVLVASIRATLAGDAVVLRQAFDISIAGTNSSWQLVLQPHNPAQREILQWMRITGYADRISKIDSQEANGDHAEMTIQEPAP